MLLIILARSLALNPFLKKSTFLTKNPLSISSIDIMDLDAVIHFAAYKAVGESVLQPLKYYRNNLDSLINLLSEMVSHGIRDFVFSSSCTVYGQPDVLPVTEAAPIKKAASPYGNTKQISEEIIADDSKVTPIQAIMLRYFNPIGAHESALIGELPLGVPNNLMPFITQTAIGKRNSLMFSEKIIILLMELLSEIIFMWWILQRLM